MNKQILGVEVEPSADVPDELQILGKEIPERAKEEHYEHYGKSCTHRLLRA